jgi:hypothetical protein
VVVGPDDSPWQPLSANSATNVATMPKQRSFLIPLIRIPCP